MMFEEGELRETDAEAHQISVRMVLGRKVSEQYVSTHGSRIFETFSRKKSLFGGEHFFLVETGFQLGKKNWVVL